MQTPNRAGAPHAWNRKQSSRGPRKAQPPARRGLSKRSSRSCPHHSPSYGRGKRNEHSSISGPAAPFRSIRSVVRERKPSGCLLHDILLIGVVQSEFS